MIIIYVSLIVFLGFFVRLIFNKIKLPALIGYLILGIIMGPYVSNIIKINILEQIVFLKTIALIIILIRAGLSLDLSKFREMGRAAILLSFLPVTFEIIFIGLLTPFIIDISYLDAFLLGSVVASVSPAVIIPRMITMIEEKKGTDKLIPQTIITSSSLDDILAIAIFTILLTIRTASTISFTEIALIPLELIIGIFSGIVLGLLIDYLFRKINTKVFIKTLVILMISLILYTMNLYLPINYLLAILAMVIIYTYKARDVVVIQKHYKNMWLLAEILLFSIVGMQVNIRYFFSNIGISLLIILISIIFRLLAVFISLYKTRYKKEEKLFMTVSLLPKATVQAAIGALALEAGLRSGELILSVAIACILITAPIGALLIDKLKNRLINSV